MTTTAKTPAAAVPADSGATAPLYLPGQLRLNLSALVALPGAPQLGELLCRLSRDNEPYDFEYSADGKLIVLPPLGWYDGAFVSGINASLWAWQLDNYGASFSQTVMYYLPNGAHLMPTASWITQERHDALRAGEYTSTIPGAPDFVVEVRSRIHSMADGLAAMEEWMAGGAKLGWYIDPYGRRVYIYRAGQEVEVLDNPQTLSVEDILPGFSFDVTRLLFDCHGA